MQIKVVPLSLTKVKKRGCVRKQMAEKFGASRFLPYLCIVNQKELVTQKKKESINKKKKERVTKMKKIVLTLVALMSMTMTFAENESAANLNNTESYNMTVNMNKLASALGLSQDQMESVAEVHKTFSSEMMFAAQCDREERSKMVDKAVNKDLAYMNYILSRNQYRKYVMLLNVTMVNRGLK